MIVHKCDRCGRELAVWMTVKVYPGAMSPAYNVGNLVHKSCELEFCEDCFDAVIRVAVIGRERKSEKGEGA